MDTAKGQWVEVGQTSGLNIDVPDLSPMSYYKFRVRAVNDQGAGQALHSDKDILAKDPYGKMSDVRFVPCSRTDT
jgi:hypothetical protein